MGREDDEYKIRREYEKRREKDQKDADGEGASNPGIPKDLSDKLNEMLDRAEPMIQQVHSSYNQFMQGVEFAPPRERRQQLDQLMTSLQLMAKPTPSYRFRYNGILTTYVTYKARWDKMIADLESGKVKRSLPARRKSSI